MRIKAAVRQLFKTAIAGITAFCILCGLCFFYYNLPLHRKSETFSTDHIRAANKFYSRGTEGFALGKIDENGFNNAYPAKSDAIDVLVMGSSHIEAFNVAQKYSTVYRLNELFAQSENDLYAYNIGMSGHTLVTCLNNLENAAEEFAPKKYIVIETPSAHPKLEDIEAALNGELKRDESRDSGIVYELQKLPYLRLAYRQLNMMGANKAEKKDTASGEDKNLESYAENLNLLLKKSAETAKNHSFELIILYQSPLKIDSKGKVIPPASDEYTELFAKACEENGITFINMREPFAEAYAENGKLPHGFTNTAVGTGHLNRCGHEVIAQTLFEKINELEK